jgi:hypothetical protein
MSDIKHTFANWSEFVEYAARATTSPELGQASRRVESRTFSETETWAEALDLANKGWTAGAERISELSAMFYNRLALRQYRQEPAFAQCGPGVYNFGRLQAGHPEPYQVWRDSDLVIEAAKSRGILKIGYNCTVSARVSTEVIFNRGAAMATLIDCLERSGFRVEVDLGESVRAKDHLSTWVAIVRLKDAQAPVEHDLLAFACAHPATTRRIMFGANEQESAAVRQAFGFHEGSIYGYPASAFDKDSSYDVTIEPASAKDDRWLDTASSVKWIAEQLEAQGVQLDHE